MEPGDQGEGPDDSVDRVILAAQRHRSLREDSHNETQRGADGPLVCPLWVKCYFCGGSVLISITAMALNVWLSGGFPVLDHGRGAVLQCFLWLLQFALNISVAEIPLTCMLSVLHTYRCGRHVYSPCLPQAGAGVQYTQHERVQSDLAPVTLINFNIKAQNTDDARKCFENCEVTYLANEAPCVYVAVVSATRDADLLGLERELALGLKAKYEDKFHYLHRPGSTLRKCGQYQDLMLYCAGTEESFAYSDERYGKHRRTKEVLFDMDRSSPNTRLLQSLRVKYTLVMDSDNTLVHGGLSRLVHVAERHEAHYVFQPCVEIHNERKPHGCTVYQEVHAIIQNLNAKSSATLFACFAHAPFFGKGLIRNADYVRTMIGSKEAPIDAVPLHALSHDTFESMLLPCMHVPSVSIRESACRTHIDWHVREKRWNMGDMMVLLHHLPRACHPYYKGQVRFSFQRTYFALAASRVVLSRPLLLLFLLLSSASESYDLAYIQLVAWFALITLSTVLDCLVINHRHGMYTTWRVLGSLLLSVLFLLPEPIVGTIRLLYSLKGLCRRPEWVPSSVMESRIRHAGVIRSSLRHFGVAQAIAAILAYFFRTTWGVLVYAVATVLLPFVVVLTSFAPTWKPDRADLSRSAEAAARDSTRRSLRV